MGLTSLEDSIKAQLKVRKNAHFMLIDGMSKLTTHKVNTCQSSVFNVSGHKWKLIVHPAGKDGTKDYLSISLRIKDKESLGSSGVVICNLKFSVIAPVTGPDMCHQLYYACYNAQDAIKGKDSFMTHKVLNSYLVNDKAIFGVEVTLIQSNCATTNIPRTVGTAERLKLIEVPKNKSRFTWKITQFSSFDGEKHSSYEFTVGPRRWKLEMYPKGNGRGFGNSLSFFLTASEFVTTGPKAKTLAVSKLRVLDQLHRNHCEYDNGDFWYSNDPTCLNASWGGLQILPLEKLNDPSEGFLVNDQIYIGVEFLLVSTTEYL